ncbi:hypothetical protein [Kribbella rubisoli]|uniref:hypothetical protein n=1 Tax=Kribbella rubisoli TaxID=3075929 RepID=UPI0018E58370|nr:hypothetical protein [Kribbella rubisoli]
MQLPPPREPLSAWLSDQVTGVRGTQRSIEIARSGQPFADEDLQLALWIAYEL